MLAPQQLAELYRTYRKEPVLSIYLDADQHDFAQRAKWEVALKNRVAEERKKAEDTALFDRAYEHLRKELEPDGRFLSGRGWVGFATPGRSLYAEGVPVPMPNLVRWEPGLRIAPYTRALKQSRPIVAVLIDSRRARLLRYETGRLTEQGSREADTYLGDLTDIHIPKRASNHSGVRGKTGTDAAQRFLAVERDRLVARVAEEVGTQAGDSEATIVIGGAERAVSSLEREFEEASNRRLIAKVVLSFDMTDAEIREVVERAASELSARRQAALLERLVERAGPSGDACFGREATEKALREKRVDTLLISDRLREADPDLADRFEGAAFEQSASVVEVSREAAAKLDEMGDGFGALLRYRITG